MPDHLLDQYRSEVQRLEAIIKTQRGNSNRKRRTLAKLAQYRKAAYNLHKHLKFNHTFTDLTVGDLMR